MKIKTTKEIGKDWNLSSRDHTERAKKKWIDFDDFIKYLDEEIEYLRDHVLKANEGVKLDGCNVERIKAWIFQIEKIKGDMLKNDS